MRYPKLSSIPSQQRLPNCSPRSCLNLNFPSGCGTKTVNGGLLPRGLTEFEIYKIVLDHASVKISVIFGKHKTYGTHAASDGLPAFEIECFPECTNPWTSRLPPLKCSLAGNRCRLTWHSIDSLCVFIHSRYARSRRDSIYHQLT